MWVIIEITWGIFSNYSLPLKNLVLNCVGPLTCGLFSVDPSSSTDLGSSKPRAAQGAAVQGSQACHRDTKSTGTAWPVPWIRWPAGFGTLL